MAGEKINISSNIENKQGFNFKKELATLFAVLSMQYSLGQQSENKDTIQDNKAKVEVVQQSENPKTADEILKKHNFTDNMAFLAAENIPLETLLSMWDDTQKALIDCIDQNIKIRLNILDKKLVMRITAQGHDLTERIKKTSEEQEKRIAEKKELLAQKETETEAKKQLLAQNNAKIQDLDKKIETLKTKTEAAQKVAKSFEKKE